MNARLYSACRDELEKLAGSADGPLKQYAQHAALNAGQAARDVRYFGDHPDAAKVAPKGTLKHTAASVVARVPSLASNTYYAALPPQLHHTQAELDEMQGRSLKSLFAEGYAPWRYPAKEASVRKLALAERLVRLAATDIPNTPRLLMRRRSAPELAQLQSRVAQGYDKVVTNPILRKLEPLVNKLPEGKVRSAASFGATELAKDPVGFVGANLVPVPGASAAYLAGKRGLERLIDKVAPV